MSYVIFDCSQFLTFSCDEAELKNKVAPFGMKVLLKEEIAKKKLTYLSPFLEENVIELFDQEFIGVFEDWKEEENPPIELVNLKKEIIDFCSKMNIESLKLIIISCASENIEEDTIISKSVQIDQLYGGLFVLSKWSFKEVADNLILAINL
ncbi:hypothetical protein ACFOQM_00890 [Paenibacillus sp. GCM10012307]|uniref:Uncharacterized protein n=1 Tax=Paenibacillus roseus TaxID=2798579 RepID=A0A934J1K0_9BACL|nr:hypothetical protein [Paenibacillus roseus]MBJ6359884.1 hypothetical protein [Paenibacillus roseus]